MEVFILIGVLVAMCFIKSIKITCSKFVPEYTDQDIAICLFFVLFFGIVGGISAHWFFP